MVDKWFDIFLQPIDPMNIAVLAVGSSKTLRFIGGPSRWSLCNSGYKKTAQSDCKEAVFLC